MVTDNHWHPKRSSETRDAMLFPGWSMRDAPTRQ
jgi:hypothetical protein